jgi:hypothetical protein
MGRRPARFTQAELTRVFAAAKQVGMAVRVDLVKGVADVVPAESIAPQAQPAPVVPKRVIVM